MPRVDIVTGNDPNRFIRGPFEWTSERTGASYWVYERLKERKTRTKRQLLTVTHDGRGLGRVLDERTGAPARWFEHDIIFPLGRWGRGEQRSFKAVEHTIAGPAERIITLKIRRLDFTFRDVDHSMKYDWIARDAAGRVLHSERYVFSPGKGLVRFTNRLKDNA